MTKKRSTEAAAHEAATRMAEGIGEALARVVNRLESLDAERETAYNQLLKLQERFNTQVARFGQSIGRTVTTATGRPATGSRPRKTTSPAAAQRSAKTSRAKSSKKVRQKSQVRCGICGTRGHNARGHAKWAASQGQ